MLTLDNFEMQVDSVIVQRGKDYYSNGSVISIEETDDNTWAAEVEGTETYTVEVTLENKTVTDYFCDCPYDGGGTCKHVVAVMFTLRDELGSMKNKGKEDKKKNVFENILQSISQKEEQEFIRSYAARNKDFKTEFEVYFADKDTSIDVEQKYTDLVHKIIKKYSDRGYIEYRSTMALADEITNLLGTGYKYIEKNNFKDAFAMVKGVLKPTMEASTDADDSNGSLGGSIMDVIKLLESIADADTAAIPVKEDIFRFLLKELKDKPYFDYGDYGYELLSEFAKVI